MQPESLRVGLTLALLGALAGCPTGSTVRGEPEPADALAMERDAAAAYAAGDWQAAADRYAALVAQAPRVAESWFRLGNARVRLGQTDPAIAAYREALVRDPGMAKAWHNMGLTQLREAAATFAQMNQYAGADDPLRDRAARLAAGITDLLSPTAATEAGDGTADAVPVDTQAPPAAQPGPAATGDAATPAAAVPEPVPAEPVPAEPVPAEPVPAEPPAQGGDAVSKPEAAE